MPSTNSIIVGQIPMFSFVLLHSAKDVVVSLLWECGESTWNYPHID